MILRFSQNSCRIIKNGLFARCLSMGRISQKSSGVKEERVNAGNSQDSTKWTTIYKLPAIRLFSTANKIKIHQGIITTILCPISWVAESSKYIPEGSFMAVAGIGVSGFAALCIFSLLLRNVVGFIYLDSTGERIKLAYVSFLGARLEAEHLIKDVIPADELPPSRYKLYYPLTLRTSKEKYAIFHKGGSMEDIEKFGAIFGYDLV